MIIMTPQKAKKTVERLTQDDDEWEYRIVYLMGMKAYIEVWEGETKLGDL